MLDFGHNIPRGQRLILHQLLHIQDRTAGHVGRVEALHGFVLGMLLGPGFDRGEAVIQMGETRLRCGVLRVLNKVLTADELH